MHSRLVSFDRVLACTLLVLGTACASTPDVDPVYRPAENVLEVVAVLRVQIAIYKEGTILTEAEAEALAIQEGNEMTCISSLEAVQIDHRQADLDLDKEANESD